ncbi:MAG: cold shock and DUF1294 domain-containing protein [Methylococcales bacterium]|nr:cold shock and DUF1294 domain-containing protein [Methylococcales bacterium]
MKGTITNWNAEKGFGFITVKKHEHTIFVHVSAFKDRKNRPKIHQKVSFRCSTDQKGQICAVKVSRRQDKKNWKGVFVLIIQLIVWTYLLIMLFFIKIPNFALYTYAGMSFITFLVYAFDKRAAKKGHWRTSENTLHFLALLGGWPGALLAQQFLRHKSRKVSFLMVFWLTFSLNMSGLFAGLFYFEKASLKGLILSIKDVFGMF